MSNQVLSAVSLDDPSGICCSYSTARVIGVMLKAPLKGNLHVIGVTNEDGSAAAWGLFPSAGYFSPPPGSGMCNGLSFVYEDEADHGKAIAIFKLP